MKHLALLAAALLVTLGARAETWRFAVIGDVPYSDHERQELPKLLEAVADAKVAFVAHIGDIKSGKDRCDDALYADRKAVFNASRVPFVYVPGDNEWTDCDRLSNGGYDPLERLHRLRQFFWPDNQSLGKKRLILEQQPGKYPEHARFQLGPVLFVTLNVPGSDNNWGKTDTPTAEYTARNPVVLDWLVDSFTLARQKKLKGVVVLFQADPGFKHFSQGLGHAGFRNLLTVIKAETERFPGPVVVVHGDTHLSRIDHPLRDQANQPWEKFTRVETFGYPIMGWTLGVIDSDSPTLFHFETHPWPGKITP